MRRPAPFSCIARAIPRRLPGTALAILLSGCATTPPPPATAAPTTPPVPSLPVAAPPMLADTPMAPPTHQPTLLRGATVMTAAGQIHSPGYVVLVDGRIADVGAGDGVVPAGGVVVDATGKFITPGIIDDHSHMGVYASPDTEANSDGNEVGSPRTPEVWSEHGVWPQDASLPRALNHGVTTIQVLPGSANLIGGRSTTFKLGRVGDPTATSARALRFPGAPQGLKMACGQNPKGVYGKNGGRPSTRMGNIAMQRSAFQSALEYRRRHERYARDLAAWKQKQDAKQATKEATANKSSSPDDPPEPPSRDLQLETLAGVLDGSILVHNHCYRADEMSLMLDVAKEFGFQIRSFHHAVEAYKIAPRLAAEGVSVSTWVDWWGFKMESYDGIRGNVALLFAAGARPIVHSDSDVESRQLNQEVGKAVAEARRLGIAIDDDAALRFITINPAWALGVEDQTGSLEKGKMGDVVVWSGHPFSVYSRVEQVFVDGVQVVDAGQARPTDITIGTAPLMPAPPSPRATVLQPAR